MNNNPFAELGVVFGIFFVLFCIKIGIIAFIAWLVLHLCGVF